MSTKIIKEKNEHCIYCEKPIAPTLQYLCLYHFQKQGMKHSPSTLAEMFGFSYTHTVYNDFSYEVEKGVTVHVQPSRIKRKKEGV